MPLMIIAIAAQIHIDQKPTRPALDAGLVGFFKNKLTTWIKETKFCRSINTSWHALLYQSFYLVLLSFSFFAPPKKKEKRRQKNNAPLFFCGQRTRA
ncbi:hypothetical protein [Taibaiella koreensis]|uniref:hypothetical protein n=1 Tax=Taibaiella koreensis TaxID=1268548 RepID=UPI0013C2EBFF|nr:hypothetical protein [Taibaiella koreensis]